MLYCFCWNKTGGEITSHIDFVKKMWFFQISLPLSIMKPLESCPRSQLLAPFVLVSISHTCLIFSIMAWGVIMEQWSHLLFYFPDTLNTTLPDTLNTTQSVWQKLHYSCFKKICLNSFRVRLKIYSCFWTLI